MSCELRESKACSIKATTVVLIKYFHTFLFIYQNLGAYPLYAHSLFSLSKLAGRHVSSSDTI